MTETTGNYTVLARRFRPQTFDEVIGQEHVAQALKNAIHAGRVAHAYLFTGARGVGKTSTARILAKTLNCPNMHEGNPCNECEICKGISEGRDVDILEIDGASNRGIDDIRMLRSNVNVKSMRTKYKIYIIDEVHMLTKEAFNALLKTLEEPPPGVKFVFCTTEPQKLPDTILSRCQRFDFSAIETDNISLRLKQIAKIEGFEVSEEAVELVARRAGGSMRDSQSLFDQLLAFGGEQIRAIDVHRLLGTADDERLMSMVKALVNQERREVLEQLDAALVAGVQLSEFVDQLLNYLRDLMVLASKAEQVPLLSVSGSCRSQLQAQANQWGLRTVLAGLEILAEAKSRMFRASHARSLVELALVRLTMLEDLQQMEALVRLLQSGDFPTIAVTGAAHSAPAGKLDPPQKKSLPPEPTPVASLPAVSEKASPRDTASAVPAAPETVVLAGQEPASAVVSPPQADCQIPFSEGEPAASPEPASVSCIEPRPGNEQKIFSQLVEAKEVKGLQQVRTLKGIAITGPNRLDLIYPAKYDFVRQSLSRQEHLALIQKVLSEITGTEIRVDFRPAQDQSAEPAGSDNGLAAPKPTAPTITRVPVEIEQIEDEFVKAAVQIFGCTSASMQKMLPGS